MTTMTNPALRLLGAAACTLALVAAGHAADTPVSSPATPPRPAAAGQKPAPKPLANRLQAICSSADLNHDGSVSLDEFHQDIVRSWHSLGPDADGYVPLSGLANVPRMGKGRLKRLAATDKDGDGRLSFKEVVETRMAYFEAADTDQNDELSLQECVAYERQRRSSKP
ncbi:hypothetical protein KW843_06640 [Acidovorax sp. sif1233]|uniref:hypothetical protein n=1 Tax=Acidovorax sp. sif1233 TaxID=2854792 RepID=UPI001C45D0D9|nr:hypothetical protein [Acidovorax sp. sif1233]MBV7454141.1 hypothetical protein [Acidovorax sp. sif1233]